MHTVTSATDYVAEPKDGPTSAAVVIHDWFGLLPHVRRAADSLASAGFLAVAPDLYAGESTSDPQRAEQLLGDLDEPAAIERLRSLAIELEKRAGVRGVAAVGFSIGGLLALTIADSGLSAVVTYYGTSSMEHAGRIRCPVLGHFAENDEWPETTQPGGYVNEYASRLRANGVDCTLHTYPGTTHSFANEDVDAFDLAAATKAWQRTVAFLERTLA